MANRLLFSFLLLTLSLPALAEPRFYAGAGIGYGDIRLSRTHFNSVSSQFHVGGWVLKNIGIELRLNNELSDDSARGITTSIPRLVTAAMRFQSPQEWGLKVYVLLGGARVTLDSHGEGGNFPGREDFDAALVNIGLLSPLSDDGRWSLFLEANRYFLDRDNDAPLTIGSLGVQYEF